MADTLMVMGNSKNLRVFNFAILLKPRKFDAHEIYVLYSMLILLLNFFKLVTFEYTVAV